MISSSPENPQKLYGYYFATEFSRYFQQLDEGSAQAAQVTLNAIIKSIRDFLSSHDDCKEGDGACAHDQSQQDMAAETDIE